MYLFAMSTIKKNFLSFAEHSENWLIIIIIIIVVVDCIIRSLATSTSNHAKKI